MSNLLEQFKELYAYQSDEKVKASPIIQAWLLRVEKALAAMDGVVVEFATTLQDRSADTNVFLDHNKQVVATFLKPMLTSTEDEPMDEECLPYFRIGFSDGVELTADDAELFSFDPRFRELINAVSGAFACARHLYFAGPWDLVARGTEEDLAAFVAAFDAHDIGLLPTHWLSNHNTPAKYRSAP